SQCGGATRGGRPDTPDERVLVAAVHRGGRVASITAESDAYLTPEARARREIDRQLVAAGWAVQDADKVNLAAARGGAARESIPSPPQGRPDYLLRVARQAVGSIEAKPAGTTLTGVERQSAKYRDGLPEYVAAPLKPLPFAYEATGVETRFTNR